MSFAPGFSYLGIHQKRNRQRDCGFHLLAHQLPHLLGGSLRCFDNEFIVDLQNELGGGDFFLQAAVHPHHGDLDNICGSALDGGVHRHPFAKGALHPVGGFQLRQGAAAADQRFGIAFFLGVLYGTLQVGGNAAVGLFVILHATVVAERTM